MADDPLAGARAKIARAREHYEAIHAELQAFGERDARTDGRPFGLAFESDRDRGECRVWWHGTSAPPIRWSIILGDFFYDLRSALDHIAYVFTGGAERCEFPIFWEPKKFWKHAPKLTEGMSEAAFTVVKGLQPFVAWPERPKATVLWQIHYLCNTDKHNVLNLTDIWLTYIDVIWAVPDALGPFEEVFVCRQLARRQRLEPDAPLAHFTWDAERVNAFPEREVEMHIDAGFHVGLRADVRVAETNEAVEGLSVTNIMKDALDVMEKGVLPKFARLL